MIASTMSDVQSLQADFIQVRQLALFEEPLKITGRLYMARPDRFAWRVAQPMKYHLIMDGDRLTQWDEDTRRVTVTDLSANPVFAQMVGRITAWFFGNYDRMTAEYQVAVDPQDPLLLHFRPTTDSVAAGFLQEISIRFQPDLRYIREIDIAETGGDTTRLTFVHTVINKTTPATVWEAGSGVR
jgi:outer membrane lipoprotein-sorting protein